MSRKRTTVAGRAGQPCTQFLNPTLRSLVGVRTGRRQAQPDLAGDAQRQARYCMGFDPDCFLPIDLLERWSGKYYPRQESCESVEAWLEWVNAFRLAYLGPYDEPALAAGLAAARDADLAILRSHYPQLVAADATTAVCIYYFGGHQYRLGAGPPVALDPNEHNVLQAFLDDPAGRRPTLAAMTEAELRNRSGVPHAAKVLARIGRKYRFAPAITLPRGKGGGGYRVNVRSAEASGPSRN
jgi:hypothetical protein